MKKIIGSTPKIRARRERIAQLYPTATYAQMSAELGVAFSTIESDCRALGLQKTNAWGHAHIEILRLMRPVMNVRDLAELMGRSKASVNKKAVKLGLKKEKQIKPKTPRAPRARKPPSVRALKEPVAKPVTPPTYRGPPPMTAAQRVTHEKLRITYAPDALPWKARRMFEPMTGIPDLSYRGQAARN